jgi:imidazolonepropionase-like amidohydrolase
MKSLMVCLAALMAAPAYAETTAIVGGTVAIGDGSQPIPNGIVVFKDGRVVSAGAFHGVPPGATVIDAHGKWVAAGIVAGFSDLGLVDVDGAEGSNDVSHAKSPFSVAIDVAPALNGDSPVVRLERAGGVTKAFVSAFATNSIFGGQGAVMTLGAGEDPVIRPRAFVYVELGEAGSRVGGGSRPAVYAALLDAFTQAEDFRRDPKSFGGREKDSLLKRADASALVMVLEGRTPLLAHVERASDIRSALALKQAHPRMRLVLLGATEGWMVARQIADAHVPVIAAALTDLPEAFETMGSTESNVGLLTKAGVTVGISTIDINEPVQQQRLNQLAGNLVAVGRMPGMTGLDWGQAFAAITARPAEALGVGDDMGSLRPGRRADVVIWDGDPLEVTSAPEAVFVDGARQAPDTRQGELLRRYFHPERGTVPRAYLP